VPDLGSAAGFHEDYSLVSW